MRKTFLFAAFMQLVVSASCVFYTSCDRDDAVDLIHIEEETYESFLNNKSGTGVTITFMLDNVERRYVLKENEIKPFAEEERFAFFVEPQSVGEVKFEFEDGTSYVHKAYINDTSKRLHLLPTKNNILAGYTGMDNLDSWKRLEKANNVVRYDYYIEHK